MRSILLFSLLIIYNGVVLIGQNAIIGSIKDEYGDAIPGVSIIQTNTSNGAVSSINGLFEIELLPEKEQSITINFIGYKTQIIERADSISSPLLITLFEDSLFFDHPVLIPTHKIYLTDVMTRFRIDIFTYDFDAFESILMEYNTELMDNPIGDYSFELGLQLNRLYTGLGFGVIQLDNNPSDSDSLKINFNTTHWGINAGYNILQYPKFEFGPLITFKWYRYRLLNYNINRSIPIETYISDRDLDIRFYQFIMTAGFHIEYIVNNPSPLFNRIAFGLFGGYCIKLHKKPLVYSKGNRLTSDNEINISNYKFGIALSIYL